MNNQEFFGMECLSNLVSLSTKVFTLNDRALISLFEKQVFIIFDSSYPFQDWFLSTDFGLAEFGELSPRKHEKVPKPIKGFDGGYSLKRLSEGI